MSEFPNNLDTDVDLPAVYDNITDLGGIAINALRSSMFAVEGNIGIGAQGTLGSIAQRLNVSLNQDGTLSTSALLGLLATISITDAQVSPTAAIQESKLALAFSTTSLYNLIQLLNNSVDVINNFLSITGIKVEPHIAGTSYNHNLTAILIDPISATEYTNRFLTNRDTLNSNTLLLDINSDLQTHERADGTAPSTPFPESTFTTLSGEVVPSNYAHAASGVYINTGSFSTIPQTETNLQNFAEEVDILLGSSVQNLFANGIIRASQSTILSGDGYAQPVVPPTPVTTHLLGVPPNATRASAPVDDITIGDDVITFNPSSASLANASFDASFAQVKPGNVITVNYGNGVAAQFAVDSVKAVINGTTRVYAVRIVGKNLYGTSSASARIDQSPFQSNKFGVLSASRAAVIGSGGNSATGDYETLTISNPKGASALGIGFNASQFDSSHYNLYLTLYPTGNPSDQVISLPAIDVTGNKGATPGAYTLDSIVNVTNLAFRAPGYNYRFVAFEYEGDFGVALADSYNDAAFSIIGNSVDGYGNPLPNSTSYPNNVVDGYNIIDPLGFGTGAANVASPAYSVSYITPLAANVAPTLIFYALRKNYYYINGTERDSLKSDPTVINSIEDSFGDGYWPATISNVTIGGSTIATTYTLDYDLSTSGIEIGKTIVVQPAFPITDSRYSYIDYGRFIVNGISFSGCDTSTPVTTLTVYDAVHGTGVSPYITSNGIPVEIYFSDDSVSFDAENVADGTAEGTFKRFFEVYVDQNGHTFTHERARFLTSDLPTGLSSFNINNVSPKLGGTSIQLNITSFSATTGLYSGYLSAFGGGSNIGATFTGKQGEVVRFYNDTNIDYIEFVLNLTASISLTLPTLVIYLFPSLQLNQEFFLLATCQMNDTTHLISNLIDQRQFGNVSENQFSDSAIDFINSYGRYAGQNGVVRGFDYISTTANQVSFTGGLALVNGSLQSINNFFVEIPIVQDNNGGSPISGVLWSICVNDEGEIILLPLTDYNASVNAINNPGRQLQLYNPANSQAYYVDSSTFSYVVNNRKDLAIIALVIAQVTNATTYTITEPDARKYVTDIGGNIPMVYSATGSQGNFKSLEAMMTWATYNASAQSQGVLRGAIVLASDPGFVSGLTLQGDGECSISSSTTISINGTSFNNVTFSISGALTLANAAFENCTFNVLSQISIGSNCTFTGCTFVADSGTLATALLLNPSAQNVSFIGCNVNYVPNTSSGYSATNLVNDGYAFLYSSVTSLMNIVVDGCTFTTNTSTRFPFISFTFNDNDGYSNAQNIRITDNKFFNTSSVDDRYAVIAMTCVLTSSQPTEGLRFIDCVIKDNICDKNQMISLSSLSTSSVVNSLIAVSGLLVDHNTCGTISITVGSEYTRNYETLSSGFAFGKQIGATVTNNVCKFIGSLDGYGKILDGILSGTISTNVATAPILISGNTAAWIASQSSVLSTNSYDLSNTVIVSKNNLEAYDPNYLTAFSSSTVAGTSYYNSGISLYIATGAPAYPNSIIDGNRISSGNYLTSSSTQSYAYSSAVFSLHNGPITNTIVNGINAGSSYAMIYCGAQHNTITDNYLYRNGVTIPAYVQLGGASIVTNNFFDSTTVDGSSMVLITGTLTGSVLQPNINYGSTSRSVTQPLILGGSSNVTDVTLGSNDYIKFAASSSAFLKFTKVINGSTLSSVTINYINNGVLSSAATFGLLSVYAFGSSNLGSGSSVTTTGEQSTTINCGATIDDSSNTYYLSVINSGSVELFLYSIVLNFTNIPLPAISNI